MKPKLETPIVGFTSDKIVMLDLDRMNDHTAVRICQYIVKRWKLGGYILLNSSRGNYQALFDKHTYWKNVMRILFSMVFKYRKNPKLQGWCIMQAIKGLCTLRISNKGKKAPPHIVAQVGTQNRAIKEYLEVRKSLRY
ncbi:MAG: hypothetical protein AVW06_04555 [Hadesarchaea archaeon DG-33-1]|nr:MAG: hypothetical protein AVW06_04555 [Hadesarchaea archaeon DG-33-1]